MTHNELIDLIDGMHSKDWLTGFGAVHAVVELHKPMEGHEHLCSACWFGDGMMSYPCPTIETIKKRLQ
jgi:hypothetical protein